MYCVGDHQQIEPHVVDRSADRPAVRDEKTKLDENQQDRDEDTGDGERSAAL